MLIGTACDERQTTLNLSCYCKSTTRSMRMKSRKGIKEGVRKQKQDSVYLHTLRRAVPAFLNWKHTRSGLPAQWQVEDVRKEITHI